MNEREAITRLKQGELDGLAWLIEQHQLEAVRVAMLITRDKQQAEDTVQTVFIRLVDTIQQFDGSRRFAPYLMRSVVNQALQTQRRNRKIIRLDTAQLTDWMQSPEAQPLQQLIEDEARQQVRDALEQLSPEQRAVIVMHYYLDMGLREIAETLSVPQGTLKWRLHSARQKLKGLLQQIGLKSVSGESLR